MKVGQNWRELIGDDANTLESALALMDFSSIGKARYHSQFDSLKQELRDTLKHHVDGEYISLHLFSLWFFSGD